MTLSLSSSAFSHEAEIPEKFTCDGPDFFPGLKWSGMPEGTKSFALICHDPDVPEMLIDKVPDLTWDHLVVFNIPAEVTDIAEGEFHCPPKAICATNSWGRNDWGGPCPPNPKHHRYFFTLYALDMVLDLNTSVDRKELLKAMQGHVLEEAELMGRYLRQEFK